ncbi:MAG: OmpA family protein [Gaiellales bacterium]
MGSLAIDSSGNLYLGVQQNATKSIAKVTPAGVITQQWAGAISDYAYGVAAGPAGTVFAVLGYSAVAKFDSSGASTATYTLTNASGRVASDTSGNAFWTTTQSNGVGKIASNAGSGAVTLGAAATGAGAVITDGAGNVYVATTSNTVLKVDSSLALIATYTVGAGPFALAVDSTYLYVANKDAGTVSRVKLSDGSVTAAWANLGLSGGVGPRYIAVDSGGYVYTGNASASPFSPGSISKIAPDGSVSVLASLDAAPVGLVVDSATNVYITKGMSMTPGAPVGVFKITQAAPAPTPTPSSNTSTTTSSAATGAPAPGPALSVKSIPAEITLDLGSSTSSDGSIPADQPITAEVPCTAPEGQLLDRCTVNVTAPEYVLLGQGDGINVRSDKKVSIGKATVKAKSGKKVIVVKVKINGKGRTALQRNLKITATVGLTAITVSNLKSTGEANTTMRLPTQLISPATGIFESNSITLNKAGVAFVNRLASLLPSKPKDMVFIGFADNTGVPGDNRWLGDRRAKAVRDALEAKGIEPVKSSIETKAARSPRDDNSKASGRERNRRVSIRITY